jgi:hypothetical protein
MKNLLKNLLTLITLTALIVFSAAMVSQPKHVDNTITYSQIRTDRATVEKTIASAGRCNFVEMTGLASKQAIAAASKVIQ